jgi:hypothetical protein
VRTRFGEPLAPRAHTAKPTTTATLNAKR